LWVLKEKRIAVWGLTFKPDTDDVRNSVAVDLVNDLIREGAQVTAYDPKGNEKVQELNLCPGVHLADSALNAVRDAEALVVATECQILPLLTLPKYIGKCILRSFSMAGTCSTRIG
jgi:UDPglucose 6-dehydrogenase